eukprot:3439719-Rhodomonas_salina.2
MNNANLDDGAALFANGRKVNLGAMSPEELQKAKALVDAAVLARQKELEAEAAKSLKAPASATADDKKKKKKGEKEAAAKKKKEDEEKKKEAERKKKEEDTRGRRRSARRSTLRPSTRP